ncbi:MAG: hypothetical protein WC243_02930 [Patescibacteria group bacterium]
MPKMLNEPIQVLALFRNNKIIPLKFVWNKRPFLVDTINFVHEVQNGSVKTVNFAIATKTDAYQISFDTKSLTWRLCDVYTPTSGK